MKPFHFCFFLLLFWSSVSFAQPRWSGEIRAKRLTEWMRDSLHLSQDQLAKASKIELRYEQQIDKSSESPATRDKVQQKLMSQKDADMKAVLNKMQYRKYYSREISARQREKIIYKGNRQPL